LLPSFSVTRLPIRNRALPVVVVVLGILLAVAIVVGSTSSSPQSLPAPAGASQPQALGDGRFSYTPNSAQVIIGLAYRFTLYTHCGLDLPVVLDFDGSFWDPAGPGPATDASGGAPAGFRQPFDHGVITLVSTNVAEYRSEGGQLMRFKRHPGTRIASPCS
jgi:hypothetical protein